MKNSRLLKAAGAAGACAAVGVIGGIAGSAAAPSGTAKPQASRSGTVAVPAPPGAAFFKLGAGGPAVHAVQIVPNQTGDGFETVTQDSGTVKSVSGDALTITEGTDKATYATPTLTLPADTTVERNFAKAALGDIQVGDHVDVTSTAGGHANVLDFDPQHWPPKPLQFMTKGGPMPPPGVIVRASAGMAYGGFKTP